MENKEQVMEKYQTVKLIGDIITFIHGITICGFFVLFLLWIVTADLPKLSTVNKSAEYFLSVDMILCICLIIIGFWLLAKEKTLKEQLEIKEDEQSC